MTTRQPTRPHRGPSPFFDEKPERARPHVSAFGSAAGTGFQFGAGRTRPRTMEI